LEIAMDRETACVAAESRHEARRKWRGGEVATCAPDADAVHAGWNLAGPSVGAERPVWMGANVPPAAPQTDGRRDLGDDRGMLSSCAPEQSDGNA